MGTLRTLRKSLKSDHKFRHGFIKGHDDEIKIDLNNDGKAELAFLDLTDDGNIDAIGLSLFGDDDFDVYLYDSNNNHKPDTIALDRNCDGYLQIIEPTNPIDEEALLAANEIFSAISSDNYITEELDAALDKMEKCLEVLRNKLR